MGATYIDLHKLDALRKVSVPLKTLMFIQSHCELYMHLAVSKI